MSGKSRFKQIFKKTEPRSMNDLQAAYNELCGQLGGYTFQIEMLNANLTETKKRLVAVINETNARRELDAKAATKTQPTAQEQAAVQ